MKIDYTKEQGNEDFRGAIQAILSMPPTVRHEFYKSAEGQAILKGIELTAENDKSPSEGLGDKREWDREEIEKMVQKLQDASPEQREIIFAILPGPVIGIVLNRLNSLAGKTPEAYARTEGEVPPGLEKGVRGPVKGTAGYFQWKQRLAATRAAKASITQAATKKPGAPPPAKAKKPTKPLPVKPGDGEDSEDSKYGKFVKKAKKG
ncbi:Uncharacterised protein [uncultured archaeon]|nr:Uncharacterised protein [uncultured archaeon]